MTSLSLQEEPTVCVTTNPDIVNLISESSKILIEEEGSVNPYLIVYLTTTSVMKNKECGIKSDSIPNSILVYYLASCASVFSDDNTDKDTVFANSVMALFDRYSDDQDNLTLRRVIIHAAKFLYDLYSEMITNRTDIDSRKAISRLSHLFIVANTLDVYLTPSKRRKNPTYFTWLKNFITEVLESNDLSFFDNNLYIDKIVSQLSHRTSVLTW